MGFAGGCVGSGQIGYSAHLSAPDLVVISPGVQVVADADDPVFYSDNYYWRNEGGSWYRSTSHTGGWVRFDAAPVAIRSIDRPAAYVHYHAAASVSHERHDERKHDREDKDEDKKEHKNKR